MELFGFFGQAAGNANPGEIARHIGQVTGNADFCAGLTAAESISVAHGPQQATDQGVQVVLRGQPCWTDGDADGPTVAATATSILQRYRVKGDAFLESLAGRFALAVLDTNRNRALLAIDRLGIERLAYAAGAGRLAFGTSAKNVARCPSVSAGINRQALFDYLVLHMIPAPETAFEGVSKLRGGTCATFEQGRLVTRRYWNPTFNERNPASFEDLQPRLLASLRRAVADTQPDERTGAFLSGGLDSSSVAGVLSQVGPRPAKTFSIGFGYEDYDELSYARIANSRFGCKGHEYTIKGSDISDSFAAIARAYDEPFGNSSALPAYYCARLALDSGVDHLLAGDGGDELFAGNSRYARQRIFQHYLRLPGFMRRGLIEPALAALPQALVAGPVRKARNYIDRANVPLPERLDLWNLMRRLGETTVVHPEFLAHVDTRAATRQMQELWDSAPCTDDVNRMLFYDWQITLADNDLRKVETMSALAGVRVSYPMLHPAVVQLATDVPPAMMMPGTKLRDFYKRAVAGFLPDEIINKTKHGFGLPFGHWLQDSPALRDRIYGNLSSLQQRRIIHPDFLNRLLHLHGNEDAAYYGVFVWVLAMLEQWLQEHEIST